MPLASMQHIQVLRKQAGLDLIKQFLMAGGGHVILRKRHGTIGQANRQRTIKVRQVPHRTVGRDAHPALPGSLHPRHLAIHAIGG
jgi:hypothetical protein